VIESNRDRLFRFLKEEVNFSFVLRQGRSDWDRGALGLAEGGGGEGGGGCSWC
jgi:hypothetical protein